MRLRNIAGMSMLAGALLASAPASATLVMAPVFNKVAGAGPTLKSDAPGPYTGPDPLYSGATVLGFVFPGFPNAHGHTLDADEPGELVHYGAGSPADTSLDTSVLFSNNTENWIITGFTLHIAGYAIPYSAVDPYDIEVVADDAVDAIWGDTSSGAIQSDIFDWTISDDRKTITFSNGHIGLGEIFTDAMFSELVGVTSPFVSSAVMDAKCSTAAGDGPWCSPYVAYIQASFQGYETPLPAAAPLWLGGLAFLGAAARLRKRRVRQA